MGGLSANPHGAWIGQWSRGPNNQKRRLRLVGHFSARTNQADGSIHAKSWLAYPIFLSLSKQEDILNPIESGKLSSELKPSWIIHVASIGHRATLAILLVESMSISHQSTFHPNDAVMELKHLQRRFAHRFEVEDY